MLELESLFKALGDETRLRILEELLKGERCVCELIPKTNRTQSTTSLQLAKLEDLGVIKSRRVGKKIFYRIVDYRVCSILNITGHLSTDQLKVCCRVPETKKCAEK